MAEIISEYTGEPYDPSWGTQLQKGKKLPLRKCLQCHEMKREDFDDRCQACYDANEQECQRQREPGLVTVLYCFHDYIPISSLPADYHAHRWRSRIYHL